MQKTKAVVLFGGPSEEYEISLRSAVRVLRLLRTRREALAVGVTQSGEWLLYEGDLLSLENDCWQKQKNELCPVYPQLGRLDFADPNREAISDFVIFPVMHGAYGENGQLQGLLDCLRLPYIGCGCHASATAFDKHLTKTLFSAAGIPTAAWCVLSADMMQSPHRIFSRTAPLGYPLFVKPCRGGSSLGAAKVSTQKELLSALTQAFLHDDAVLAEEYIEGVECEVAVFGKTEPVVSCPGEIETGAVFYDYETKYTAATARLHVPARISALAQMKMREFAERGFRLLSARHLSRFDFFVRRDGTVLFNEVNTLPGLTERSLFPSLVEASGVSFSDFLDSLCEVSP